MNGEEIADGVIAAMAVLGSIGSVLLLAVRVGRLSGSFEARINAGEDDRRALWSAIGVLTGRYDRHLERHEAKRR